MLSICSSSLHTLPNTSAKFQPILTILIFDFWPSPSTHTLTFLYTFRYTFRYTLIHYRTPFDTRLYTFRYTFIHFNTLFKISVCHHFVIILSSLSSFFPKHFEKKKFLVVRNFFWVSGIFWMSGIFCCPGEYVRLRSCCICALVSFE